MGVDIIRGKMGISYYVKDRLGVVFFVEKVFISGLVEFEVRYDGKKGNVYLLMVVIILVVVFGMKKIKEKIGLDGEEKEDLYVMWSVFVLEIVELKKFGGYGWKVKLVVGWSLEREVSDGVELRMSRGEVYKIMVILLRDELFNWLIVVGG